VSTPSNLENHFDEARIRIGRWLPEAGRAPPDFADADFRKREFRLKRWRRDLNPRTVLAVSRFQGECIRPLCHATADKSTGWAALGRGLG
jgi:hypothetical protein